MPPDFELAHPSLVSFLERLLSERLTWPVIGYELEADGIVAATAETAWPDCKVAVIEQELTADRDAFERAGWRAFTFGSAGLTSEDVATRNHYRLKLGLMLVLKRQVIKDYRNMPSVLAVAD